jgi:hypothetical protein
VNLLLQVLLFSFATVPAVFFLYGGANKICCPKENYMKRILFHCLLLAGSFSSLSFATMHPLPAVSAFRHLTTPVNYNLNNKATVLYIPGSCSGMVNEAVAGEGEMTISVLGKIENEQLSVQVKVNFKGKATTAVEGIAYRLNGTVAASVTQALVSEPVDIFVRGHFKLEAKTSLRFISATSGISPFIPMAV